MRARRKIGTFPAAFLSVSRGRRRLPGRAETRAYPPKAEEIRNDPTNIVPTAREAMAPAISYRRSGRLAVRLRPSILLLYPPHLALRGELSRPNAWSAGLRVRGVPCRASRDVGLVAGNLLQKSLLMSESFGRTFASPSPWRTRPPVTSTYHRVDT